MLGRSKNNLFFLLILSYLEICDGRLAEKNQSELIKAITEKFDIKSVFLISRDETLGSGEVFNVHKNLSRTLKIFTAVLKLRHLWSNRRRERVLVVVHLNEANSKEIVSISNKMSLSQFTWLCFSFSPGLNLTYLSDAYIPLDANFLYASYDDEKVLLNQVYQVTRDSPKVSNYYGTWENFNGLVAEEVEFFDRRKDFAGAKLKCSLKNGLQDPFNPCKFRHDSWDTDPPMFECLFFKIWKDFGFSFNFTSEFLLFPFNASSSSVLIMEKVRKGEVDGTMAPFMMTSARVLNNEFLWPISSSEMFAYSKVPDQEINFSSYLQPMCFSLWMSTLAWVVIVTMFTVLAKLIFVKALTKGNFVFLRDGSDYLTAPFSALCSQSFTIDLHGRISFRIIVLAINVLPLFLFPAYSGSLILYLGNPPSRLPFSNLREFEENGEYELMALKPSFVYTFLMNDAKFAGARENDLVLADDKMPVNDVHGFALLCENKLIYIVYQPVLLKSRPRCKIFAMDEHFGTFFGAMILPKDSPYFELFNRILQKRVISGIYLTDIRKLVRDKLKIELILKKWKGTMRNFQPSQFEHSRAFSFEDVLPIFAVFAAGLFLAVIIFLIEIFYGRILK